LAAAVVELLAQAKRPPLVNGQRGAECEDQKA
jgi:hypothetical protein